LGEQKLTSVRQKILSPQHIERALKLPESDVFVADFYNERSQKFTAEGDCPISAFLSAQGLHKTDK